MTAGSPLGEYTQRLALRSAVVAGRERVHIRLGNAKVAIFLGAMVYGAVMLGSGPSVWVFVPLAAAYVVLAVWHELTMRAMTRAQAAVGFYADGIARLDNRWAGTGETGERFRNRDHPYAEDLDVFGRGSLFQLVSGARTPIGEARLAAWLTSAAEPPVIRERQACVTELRPRLDLRERIAVVNAGERRTIAADRLIAWAEAGPVLPQIRAIVVLLALAFVGAVAYGLAGGSPLPASSLAVVNLGTMFFLMKRGEAFVESLSSATQSAALDLVSKVIVEIERERFDDPVLIALAARLTSPRHGASAGIARLARVSDWADSRHNVFARLLEFPVFFTLQVAYAAEAWKAAYGRELRDWVDTVGEMEALFSFAGYAFEHPRDPFPELLDAVEGDAIFDATGLAHPLIAPTTAVANDVGLGRQASSRTRILIVSGSNMSGKSTLMRTVGLNAVMALAGAPVRATRLRLTPVSIGTCLRHTDSLQEGRSGFYTEALRLRLVCDLLDGPRRVLFLFDELLGGTNSRDRRLAAEGLVGMMLASHGIGMITTHDLALTEIAAIFPGDVRNVHLQDHVEDGQMRFDYKVREGIITHSNALELMRMIGLDV